MSMIGIPQSAYKIVTIFPMGVFGTRLPYPEIKGLNFLPPLHKPLILPIVVNIAKLNMRLLLNVQALSPWREMNMISFPTNQMPGLVTTDQSQSREKTHVHPWFQAWKTVPYRIG